MATYNDREVVEAICNVRERKKEIRSLLRSDKIPLRICPLGTMVTWPLAFDNGDVKVNPVIPRFTG